jgi:hypothetical protein
MNKSLLTRTLLAAGIVAAAGIAQAQTTDAPQQAGEASTMTRGVPNAATTNSPYPDGTVVLPQHVVVGPTTTTTYQYYAVPQVVTGSAVVVYDSYNTASTYHRGSASATTNVPGRAGEVSTMTGGVPNMTTNNNAPVTVGTARVLVPGTYYLY